MPPTVCATLWRAPQCGALANKLTLNGGRPRAWPCKMVARAKTVARGYSGVWIASRTITMVVGASVATLRGASTHRRRTPVAAVHAPPSNGPTHPDCH